MLNDQQRFKLINMASFVLFTLLCYCSSVLSGMLGPCKKQDTECLQKSIGKVFPIVLGGIPSLEIKTSDPLFVDVINGDLSGLKYKLINNTITGYKKCAIENSIFDVDALKLYLEMHCSNVDMVGDYEISGKLLTRPVEGKGTYRIIAQRYLIPVNAGLKIMKGKDGKSYVNIKNFEVKPKALGPVNFEFNNLFNGRKDLSDALIQFAHENYRELSELVQDPIFSVCIKWISRNLNDFLKTEPLQEIFLD